MRSPTACHRAPRGRNVAARRYAPAISKGGSMKTWQAVILTVGLVVDTLIIAASDRQSWTVAAAVILGLMITVIAGEYFGKRVADAVDTMLGGIRPPRDFPPDIWRELTERQPGPGKLLGRIERLLFYGAFLSGGWPLAVGWLVLQAAANWQG